MLPALRRFIDGARSSGAALIPRGRGRRGSGVAFSRQIIRHAQTKSDRLDGETRTPNKPCPQSRCSKPIELHPDSRCPFLVQRFVFTRSSLRDRFGFSAKTLMHFSLVLHSLLNAFTSGLNVMMLMTETPQVFQGMIVTTFNVIYLCCFSLTAVTTFPRYNYPRTAIVVSL